MPTYNKVGFHIGSQPRAQGYGDYISSLDDAGIPAVCMSTGGEGLGDIVAQWDNGSTVPHVAVVRYMPPEGHQDGSQDVPRYDMAPEAAFVRFWNWYKPQIGQEVIRHKDKIVLKLGNELDKNHTEWLAAFYLVGYEIAQIDPDGPFRIAGFSFASGEPEPEHWRGPKMRQYLQLCADDPIGAAICLHEYSYADDLESAYPHLIGRFLSLFAECDDMGIKRPSVYIHEWGWRQDTIPGDAVQQLPFAAELYAMFPEVKGAGLWTLQGAGTYGNPHISTKVQPLIEPITNYSLTARFPDPPDNGGNMLEYKDVNINDVTNPVPSKARAIMAFWNDESGEQLGWYAHEAPPGTTRIRFKIQEELEETENPNPPPVNPPPSQGGIEIADIDSLNQRDPAWANVVLGQNTGHGKTIGNWGCLLVAYNVMARYWGLTDRLPPAENDHMVSKGAFSAQYIQPAALRTAYPDLVTYDGYLGRDSSAMRPKIREWIDRGWPVPCRVDFNPATSDFDQHWVLVVGYIGDTDFIMADPWHGDIDIVNNRYPIAGSDILEAIFYTPSTATQPPPPGQPVDIAPYFVPAGQFGRYVVFHFDDGRTQPQQMQKLPDGRVILWKGEGQWIDGKQVFDYESWFVDDEGVHKLIDTSSGGRTAYDLDSVIWLPKIVQVGMVYPSSPNVRNFDRVNCQSNTPVPTNDYIYVKALLPTWTSPVNSSITFNNVLVCEWRKTPDINTPPIEVYHLAPDTAYAQWNNGAVGELPEGRQPLSFQLTNC